MYTTFPVCKRSRRHSSVTTIVMLSSFLFASLVLASLVYGNNELVSYPTDVNVELNKTVNVTFTASVPLESDVFLSFNESEYVDIPESVLIPRETGRASVQLTGRRLTSRTFIEVASCHAADNDTECPFDLSEAFVRITVYKSAVIDWLVDIVGWCYFFAWSISFYPQIFLNLRRRSVIGLNFDFLLLNVIGFTAYTFYNLLIYFNESVQAQYELEHPRSPLPVLLNDVVFAVHALFACLVTVIQCFFYERENQRVSRPCFVLASLLILAGIVTGSLTSVTVISTLQYVNSLSYIKMIVTLSKYFPQALFNFCRKSTVGWSIGNVLLDFTGGSLDILQMVLQATNVSDWSAFLGNPVKFGLGLVSIVFDVVFIVQHYVLYRDVQVVHNNVYEGIENPESGQSPPHSDYGSQGSQDDAIIVVND